MMAIPAPLVPGPVPLRPASAGKGERPWLGAGSGEMSVPPPDGTADGSCFGCGGPGVHVGRGGVGVAANVGTAPKNATTTNVAPRRLMSVTAGLPKAGRPVPTRRRGCLPQPGCSRWSL